MTPSFDPSPLIPYVEGLGLKYHYIRDDSELLEYIVFAISRASLIYNAPLFSLFLLQLLNAQTLAVEMEILFLPSVHSALE